LKKKLKKENLRKRINEEKVVLMFYLFMRDSISVGELTNVIEQTEDAGVVGYANKNLESLARELVERLK